MTARELPQLGCERPSVVNPRAKARKKPAAKHKHKWEKATAGLVSWNCTKEGFPSCHSTAVVVCACGHGRCAKHAPRPRKAKPFRRWSVEDLPGGYRLLYDGQVYKHKGGGVRGLAKLLNKHRVRP